MAGRPEPATPAAESAPQVFVDDLETPVLRAEDRHHLERARRLRPGDDVVLADGRGRWRVGRLDQPVAPIGDVRFQAPTTPTLTVGFALVKGSRSELIVAKLTELGIDRIVAVAADRSVVRWDQARTAGHLERLRRVAREAAMQSRRAWLPEVSAATDLAGLVAGAGPSGIALAQPGGQPPSLRWPTVVVGPEGGWTDEELAHVPDQVALGDQILRVETAAITVGALLGALRSGLTASPGTR